MKFFFHIKNTKKNDGQFNMLKKLEINKIFIESVLLYCKNKKINFLCTPFDIESLNLLYSLKIFDIKVASGEINNYFLLKNIAKKANKIFLSTGMADIKEISQALEILQANGAKKKNITLLHCHTDYPTDLNNVNLRAMTTMKNKFKALESDFSEGVPSVLKSKTSSNVTSLFRKSSEGTAEERKLLIEFDGQPEDLPKHLYKIAEVDPDLKVSIIYALSVGKSYHHVSDLMRRFDMPDVYVALTKMDLFEVSTAELSAIADANRKILFFSGLKLIEDGLDFAKVAVMESFLTNLIDNESW